MVQSQSAWIDSLAQYHGMQSVSAGAAAGPAVPGPLPTGTIIVPEARAMFPDVATPLDPPSQARSTSSTTPSRGLTGAAECATSPALGLTPPLATTLKWAWDTWQQESNMRSWDASAESMLDSGASPAVDPAISSWSFTQDVSAGSLARSRTLASTALADVSANLRSQTGNSPNQIHLAKEAISHVGLQVSFSQSTAVLPCQAPAMPGTMPAARTSSLMEWSDIKPPMQSSNVRGHRHPSNRAVPECVTNLITTNTRQLDSKLWHACAGGLVNLPSVDSQVVYWPQGHAEACLDTPKPLLCKVQRSATICRVACVEYLVDAETDDVYAKLLLIPEADQERALRLPPPGTAQGDSPSQLSRRAVDGNANEGSRMLQFAKTLTQSDANNGGGFSVPRYCAETIFPQLDYSVEPPRQTIVAWDAHGEPWKFRHIYRGTPRRHLLTTGWSTFVNAKKLAAGDAVAFLRSENDELCVGVRRAYHDGQSAASGGSSTSTSGRTGSRLGASGLYGDLAAVRKRAGMTAEAVEEAAAKAEASKPFEVLIFPRGTSADFCVDSQLILKAITSEWKPGLRFSMAFETDDLLRMGWRRGTVVAVRPHDPVLWPQSMWRSLVVQWDDSPPDEEATDTVSPWEVELLASEGTSPASSRPLPSTDRMPKTAELHLGTAAASGAAATSASQEAFDAKFVPEKRQRTWPMDNLSSAANAVSMLGPMLQAIQSSARPESAQADPNPQAGPAAGSSNFSTPCQLHLTLSPSQNSSFLNSESCPTEILQQALQSLNSPRHHQQEMIAHLSRDTQNQVYGAQVPSGPDPLPLSLKPGSCSDQLAMIRSLWGVARPASNLQLPNGTRLGLDLEKINRSQPVPPNARQTFTSPLLQRNPNPSPTQQITLFGTVIDSPRCNDPEFHTSPLEPKRSLASNSVKDLNLGSSPAWASILPGLQPLSPSRLHGMEASCLAQAELQAQDAVAQREPGGASQRLAGMEANYEQASDVQDHDLGSDEDLARTHLHLFL